MEKLSPARLEFTEDGTPYSTSFGDVYHSAHGGPAQARHVFLAGNDLPARWQGEERFVILETGFGLGLNFLATWQAWQTDARACERLHFVSFEKHPFTLDDLRSAQQAWPEYAALAQELQAQWPLPTPGMHRLHLAGGRVILSLYFGDACRGLRNVELAADAFYLDGFSPSRNPELWSPELCKALARLAAPGATLATWSVAGHVREALQAAEFELEKRPGFAGKRQMLSGRFRSRRPPRFQRPKERSALIVGAGIAGCTMAHALARAGWQVTLLEAEKTPATQASGNLAGVLRPLPSADDNRVSRLTRAGYFATRALLHQLPEALWAPCGVLHLGRDDEHSAQQRRAVEQLGLPTDLLQFLDAKAASQRIDWPVSTGGWWFPGGGWVQPAALCRAILDHAGEQISFQTGCPVARLHPAAGRWQALDETGHCLAEAAIAIVCAGAAATQFEQLAWLPQKSARGQVTHLPSADLPVLPSVLCKQGYAAPSVSGFNLIGATLQAGDLDASLRTEDHQENLRRLELSLPGFSRGLSLGPEQLAGKVGFRPMSPDRLPMVGAVPLAGTPKANSRLHTLARHTGLYCVQGFGARGIVWSALMADLLLSLIEGDPLPIERDLAEACDPGRFLLKAARLPQDAQDDST